ncbi:MAG: ribosome silencing factor [Gammaproteobacteria bacterium]|nr:ribosome silencing factor [Gammaproteobacteria bacterium]
MQSRRLAALAEAALDDMKARDVRVIDVRKLTTVTDYMVIASGTSDRHVRSIAGRIVERATEAGFSLLGTEGEEAGEWVLVDLQDVVVHVMLGRVRDLYKLENLWDMGASQAETAT